MLVSDLDFNYPEELVALKPEVSSRIMFIGSQSEPEEISLEKLLAKFSSGDVLVLNDTRVLKRRVFSTDQVEILFLDSEDKINWEVLFPSKKYSVGSVLQLPGGIEMKLAAKGRPQKVQVSKPLTDVYFSKVGELPLPPYIQKARGERHNVASDESWYQTVWATKPGSFAAPTASLHFKNEHLQLLKEKGVIITYVTLHVGLGTFLPVTAEDLDHHEMHPEWVEVPATTWSAIESAKSKGKKIWALGTTVCRSLESVPRGLLNRQDDGVYQGLTNLLLQPRETEAGSDFKVVNVLLTNFHQPKSTLLALVASFAGLERVKTCYKWAIERKFRLFSYGDLSVWEK